MKNKALTEPERLIGQSSLYINRELSWLEFNYRVLAETWDKNNPLFEKLKFLAIFSSNLDEFFMIRVASLADKIHAGYNLPDPAGHTPRQQLDLIAEIVQKMVKKQYSIFNKSNRPALEKSGFHLLNREQLSTEQNNYLGSYFQKQIFPALTPMAVDKSRPFPLVLNRSLNLAVLVEEDPKLEPVFATVQVPSVLPRLLELPKVDKDGASFILLEDIILLFIDQLFSSKKILAVSPYRITRNSDLQFAEEDVDDLVKEIEKSLKRRRWGAALRLEIDAGADQRILGFLKKSLNIKSRDIYQIKGPIDLTFFMRTYSSKKFSNLKYLPVEPVLPAEYAGASSIFDLIAEGDRFLHHPYDSFVPVTAFVEEAAADPDVLAIKQTLYRVSGDSPIIKALGEAAERGKQVTVLLEVKARFDEESNINWAKRLEQAGCHVIFGLVGLKTHSKITLVVRLEEGNIKRYLHLGTGNYNDNTARLYTDMGLFTANDRYGAEASAFFNMITGCSEPPDLHKLIAAPNDLRPTIAHLIRREAENARRGENAYIVAQINSLADKKIIAELYAASIAGVKIDLLVRGICCLRPGIKNVSENIRVHSIVGRFLEHSRIYRFCSGGENALYLSSADLMTRNLDRRVELLFQVEDKVIKARIEKILDTMFSDTLKTRVLESDGSYRRIDKRGRQKINAQESLLAEAGKRAFIPGPEQSTGSSPVVMQPVFSPGII
jgi:polyphosphate kinase